MTVKEHREEIAKMEVRMREMLDKAEGENRDLSAEEDGQFKALHDKVAEHRTRADRQEKLDTLAMSKPKPMMSRRLMMSTSRDTGSMNNELKNAGANPMIRLTWMSVSCKSFLISSASRLTTFWLVKSTRSVTVNTPTPYQALAGLGQE